MTDTPPHDSSTDSTPPSPSLADATRAQATQIGLILAIGSLFSLLLVAQVSLAPQVQSETELRHSSTVLADMQEIQADRGVVADGAGGQASVLRMGDSYPTYLILAQPPGPYGTLDTEDAGRLTVTGATATNPSAADHFAGDPIAGETTALEYTPGYHQYDAPTTRLAQGVLTEEYGDHAEPIAGGEVVDGRNLNLVWTTGDIATGQTKPLTLRTERLSAADRAIRVEQSTDATPIRVRFETTLSERRWRELLAAELDEETTPAAPAYDGDGRYVTGIEKTDGTLTVSLETGVSYRLDMAKVGWRTGHQPGFPDDSEPEPAYLATDDRTPVVAEETTTTLTARVADGYANPQPDVPVTASVETDGRLAGGATSRDRLSAGDGTVTFEYTAPEITRPTNEASEQTERVRVTLPDASGGDDDPRVVVFEIRVQNTHD
ncbi:hypothetical protein [Halosegnis longus]|uniref:hypothetical protein n=1 Tax=Halosegnis longus TaxID=2216012 RepID=UPI00096A307C|nr:hypothetical protein [Salella cibi]